MNLCLIDRLDSTFSDLRKVILRQDELLSALPDVAPDLFDLFDASGLAIRLGNVWAHMSDSPNTFTLDQLSTTIDHDTSVSMAFIDSLVRICPALGAMPVAGALAIKMRTHDGHHWRQVRGSSA